MSRSGHIPWQKIHEFLLEVGALRDPYDLCIRALQQLYPLIPYDQARLYFLNESGRVCDQYLIGVDPIWSELYLEYYSKLENGRYSITELTKYLPPPLAQQTPVRHVKPIPAMHSIPAGVHDWLSCNPDQFVIEYVRPQGLKHSAGFALRDADLLIRCVFCIDRTNLWGFSQQELDILCLIQPHLENLHQNLFVRASPPPIDMEEEIETKLTPRELEIARLLCKGLTPARISSVLFLSKGTVYRHIANIHAKLGVRNRQELLLKLISSGISAES